MPLKLKLTLVVLIVAPVALIGGVIAMGHADPANPASYKANIVSAAQTVPTLAIQTQTPQTALPKYDPATDKDKTITQIFSEKLLGGYLAGDLNPAIVGSAQYNTLLDAATGKIITDRDDQLLPYIKASIIANPSRDEITAYISKSIELLNRIPVQNHYLDLMKNPDGPTQEAQVEFSDLGKVLSRMYLDLSTMPVPQQMADWQLSVSDGLRHLSLVYAGLGNFNADPMLVVYRLDQFSDALSKILIGADQLNDMAKTYGITTSVRVLANEK